MYKTEVTPNHCQPTSLQYGSQSACFEESGYLDNTQHTDMRGKIV